MVVPRRYLLFRRRFFTTLFRRLVNFFRFPFRLFDFLRARRLLVFRRRRRRFLVCVRFAPPRLPGPARTLPCAPRPANPWCVCRSAACRCCSRVPAAAAAPPTGSDNAATGGSGNMKRLPFRGSNE